MHARLTAPVRGYQGRGVSVEMTRHVAVQGVCFHWIPDTGFRLTDRGGSVHSSRKFRLSLMAVLAAVGLLAAACGSSSKSSSNSPSGGTVNTMPVPQGGTLT